MKSLQVYQQELEGSIIVAKVSSFGAFLCCDVKTVECDSVIGLLELH
jgi:hypothetical protein